MSWSTRRLRWCEKSRQEPFDELPARIFVPGEPRTGDTQRNPREDQKVKAPYRVLESAFPPLSHRALSAMTITP